MYGDLEGMGKKVVIGYLKVLDIHQESLRTIWETNMFEAA